MPANRRPQGPRRAARLAAEALESRRLMAVITVNSAGDVDGNGGEDGGPSISLRQAIEISNATLPVGALSTLQAAQVVGPLTSPNVIDFAIPGAGPFVIRPPSALPAIVRPVVIDGYSQPGAHPNAGAPGSGDGAVLKIALDGSLAHGANGLDFQCGQSAVRGLAIGGFLRTNPAAVLTGNGILLELSAGDVIRGDFLGTDASGLVALPNGRDGVDDFGGGSTIGGTAGGAANVVSGNLGDGVSTAGRFAHFGDFAIPSGSDTLIQGNLIGTNAAGLGPLPNRGNGIASAGGRVTIGGTASGVANVIADNLGVGVKVAGVGDPSTFATVPTYTISGNSIHDNAGPGIVYDPPGKLNVSPTPVLGGLTMSPLGAFVSGSLVGTPMDSYTVEFFSNTRPDASYAGEGEVYLGSTTTTTNPEGLAGFTFSTPTMLIGRYVSATATEVPPPGGGASEGTSPFARDLLGFPASTTNTLLGPGGSTAVGQPVVLTSVVASAGDVPTGLVEFNVDGQQVGIATLDAGGLASLVIGPLAPGFHAITSIYLGDSTHSAAPSEVLDVSVLAPVAVSLYGPPPVAIQGQPITFLAEVSTPGGGAGGYVAFLEGGLTIGLVALDARGVATFTTAGLAPGSHAITADYLGNAGHAPGVSNAVSVAVFDALAFGGPSVTSAAFSGAQAVAITFNRGLLLGPAVDLANYAIVGPGHRKVAILSASYDAATATVTLTTAQKLDPRQAYQLTINGHKAGRVVDVFGIPLNGQPKGKPGHDDSGRIQHAKAPARVAHPAPTSPPDPNARSRFHAKKR